MVVHHYADSNLDLDCACFASKSIGEDVFKRLCDEEEEKLETFMRTTKHRMEFRSIHGFFLKGL